MKEKVSSCGFPHETDISEVTHQRNVYIKEDTVISGWCDSLLR